MFTLSKSLHHFLRRRARLSIAILCGIVLGLLLPERLGSLTRTLAGWNAAVWSYLLLMGWLMTHADPARVRALAEQEDENAVAVLAILSIAAVISLAAIVLELATLRDLPLSDRLGRYVFTAGTVAGSWLLVGTLFTIHYARMFYRSPAIARDLNFPGNTQQPDYWDFLYFSFTIAVAAQTSDVVVQSRAMRKAVLAQALLSFVFNLAILGLSINIAAGLIEK